MTLLPAAGDAFAMAAKVLRQGHLVVFPSETVYGLGANALDPKAVARIYKAKGRPSDNPLIVHVPDLEAARSLSSEWPPLADALAARFWPGPLTLVVPRAPHVPAEVSAGLDSLALRVPDHAGALHLLRACGFPIAAPSANRSGRPSPTRVHDAVKDLGDSVGLFLDGGPCRIGVESTVVSLLGKPTLLRPGGVPREEIEKVTGPLADAAPDAAGPAPSPGMRHRHYAPDTLLLVVAPGELAAHRGPDTVLVASRESGLSGKDVVVPGSRTDPAAWACDLFAVLRDLDEGGHRRIVVEAIPEKGLGAAVMDRLRRAAAAHAPSAAGKASSKTSR
jgi:L-threonylcarbamoyladenylate synthase